MDTGLRSIWPSCRLTFGVLDALSQRPALVISLVLSFAILSNTWARAQENKSSIRRNTVPEARMDPRRIALPVLDGKDIRFTRLSTARGLSQTRVSQIIQDNQGFIWFGTQSGLNRYDGYNFKVFKHDPQDPDSLSGVYIYSLFKDRSGTIWVGTDQLLDRFDPLTEKFRHYRFDAQPSKGLATIVNHISQDSSGMLWLSTGNGLFRLEPATGRTAHFSHDANDPSSLGGNDVKSTGEDREGTFWVATTQSLDEFDRNTCEVRKRIPISDSGMGASFHEDRFGVFWLIYGTDGLLATVDRKAGKVTPYSFNLKERTGLSKIRTYAMLEDSKGTMWFGTEGAGLLKFDREHRRFVSYSNHPGDTDSLADTRVTTLFEDREGNIWIGLHQVGPNFFAKKPQVFEKLTHQPGNPNSLGSSLVSALYEDGQGVLWVGTDHSLQRIDRKTGRYSTFEPVSGGEVLSIIEGGPDTLWFGTARNGVMRYDRRTGQIKAYRHNPADPSTVCSEVVERLLIDHNGTLWAASWDGLCRFDPSSGRFSTYRQDPSARGLNYYAIAEDRHGDLWLGSNLGLQRFEPDTGKFTAYNHKLDDPKSLSDNRVNSVFFDQAGAMWVGTQNGLDKFEPQTGTFTLYGERDGMAGNVVSCILEDRRGRLWMSTNQGVSSFDTLTKRFNNYTAADGLPGADLTGWGACFKSAASEMFFGGFSGVTAFYPDRVVDSSYVPPIVLTEFRLSGRPVEIGGGSPLSKTISYTTRLALSHEQRNFSLAFSALSYFSPGTNRYRYKLEGLGETWHESGSSERLATYTTLPTGVYTFRVQGATSRGVWSEPGAAVLIEILPPWWSTLWFRTSCSLTIGLMIWLGYRLRTRQIAEQLNLRFEERLRERMRLAQDLHDTLLQNVTGLSLQISGLSKTVTAPESVKDQLQELRRQAQDCIREARQAVWDLRSLDSESVDLATALRESGERLTAGKVARFNLYVEGEPRPIALDFREQLLRIAREAISNASHHSLAEQIEVRLRFDRTSIRLQISDNGRGFNVEESSALPGHFGLRTMQERAGNMNASIVISSEVARGTRVEVTVPSPV